MASFTTGTFTVGADGKVDADYLFDGGWFRGELAVFSLEGMEQYTPGSTAFMLEAGRRALTNSAQGHILIRDNLEGAKFSANLGYEANFNTDPQKYRGVNSVYMTPGDEVGLMLVQHTTVQETVNNPQNISQFGKTPLFSIPEANLAGAAPGQFVDVNGTGTVALEDILVNRADKDYNDMIFQLGGLEGNLAPMAGKINPARDWRKTDVGQQLLDYTNSQFYQEGVFEVDKSGEVVIDFLYDGGMYQGEVGIFSLAGMNLEDVGSEAFIEEAITRANSNTKQGHIVLKDLQQGAKLSALLNWEEDFNTGMYQGKETFSMNPGEFFGLVLVPDGTLEAGLTADESIIALDPLFSMSRANHNDQIQFANIETDTPRRIVSFEDERPDNPLNQDYNDIILAIDEVKSSIGIPAIEEVIAPERNWSGLSLVNEDLSTYFFNPNAALI
jgi:hypothetical protein